MGIGRVLDKAVFKANSGSDTRIKGMFRRATDMFAGTDYVNKLRHDQYQDLVRITHGWRKEDLKAINGAVQAILKSELLKAETNGAGNIGAHVLNSDKVEEYFMHNDPLPEIAEVMSRLCYNSADDLAQSVGRYIADSLPGFSRDIIYGPVYAVAQPNGTQYASITAE